MQTNFIFQQFKLRVQKSENQAPQNYQSMFTEVTSFEEVKLSYTRASKFHEHVAYVKVNEWIS